MLQNISISALALPAAAAATENFVVSCGLQERVTHLVSSSIFKERPSEMGGQWGYRPTRFIKESLIEIFWRIPTS